MIATLSNVFAKKEKVHHMFELLWLSVRSRLRSMCSRTLTSAFFLTKLLFFLVRAHVPLVG